MTVRRSRAARLELAAAREALVAPPPLVAGRVRSSRPPKAERQIAQAVVEAAEKGRKLLIGEDPVNGHHVANELAGAWVAAHRMLHETDPVEASVEWPAIVSAARRVFVTYLDGDFEQSLDLVRWSLEKRNRNRQDGRRLTWKSVFSAANVTDFKVSRVTSG